MTRVTRNVLKPNGWVVPQKRRRFLDFEGLVYWTLWFPGGEKARIPHASCFTTHGIEHDFRNMSRLDSKRQASQSKEKHITFEGPRHKT